MRNWDRYFLEVARQTAKMSTCLRRQYGAVAVQGRHIVATGFNGPPSQYPHCTTCYREKHNIKHGQDYVGCPAVHAEANVVTQAAKLGVSLGGATVYVTGCPCSHCAGLMINAGIVKVVFSESEIYSDTARMLEVCGVEMEVI